MVWLVDEAALPKPAIMVLLNLALIAGDALVRGGQLDIGAELRDDGNVEIVVRGQGPRIVLDPELRAALTGQLDNPVDATRAAAACPAASPAAETRKVVVTGNGGSGICNSGGPRHIKT